MNANSDSLIAKPKVLPRQVFNLRQISLLAKLCLTKVMAVMVHNIASQIKHVWKGKEVFQLLHYDITNNGLRDMF